jgi:hypothetical protein
MLSLARLAAVQPPHLNASQYMAAVPLWHPLLPGLDKLGVLFYFRYFGVARMAE